jgi:DNA-binding transcriptional ArsR family regulator
MVEPHFVDHADPEEVFALLSNDRRVTILQALWEADGDEASFSELRDAVGMRDSGQFSYHLDKLVGRFVAQTDDGYELTRAGMRINGAIEAGSYTMDGSIDPIDLDHPCPRCGGERTLRYADETVLVTCEACPVGYEMVVPPAVFAAYDREAVPRVASEFLRSTFHHITSGFCPFCDGPTEPTVEQVPDALLDTEASADEGATVDDREPNSPDPSAEDRDGGVDLPWIRYTCKNCGSEPTIGLSIAFMEHPAVVRFYYDRGVDPRERLVWDVADADPDHETIVSRDPFRASVTYAFEGETLTLTLDEDGQVLDVEESAVGRPSGEPS